MRLLLPWLADHVDVPTDVDAFAHALTAGALEVEGIERPGQHIDPKAVVAKVTAVRAHPNADRLRLVTLTPGKGRSIEVVCGAPNVAAGQHVVFLPSGATFLTEKGERRTLTAATIRGVVSNGMVASERELGMSGEHEGILVLDASTKVGTPAARVLGGDTIIEVAVPANRGDCMGLQGIAREVASLTGAKLRTHRLRLPTRTPKKLPLTVSVKQKDLCPRYSALVLTNVAIQHSPVWMQRRLQAVGIRPISNIVDLTNYLMVETGQPFHAFDYDLLAGHRMSVERLERAATLTTLDGVARSLPAGTGIIRDAEKVIDLAGIMGGQNSAVSERTTTVVLQAAVFGAEAIRTTSRRIGHRTDAVGYFEKGLDVEGTLPALSRALDLIEQEWPEVRVDQLIDLRGTKRTPPTVRYRPAAAGALLGYDIPPAKQKRILQSLGYTVKGTAATWSVTPPSWRLDVEGEHDLIEDVARIYGYDHVPSALPQGTLGIYEPIRSVQQQREVKQLLLACGFTEVVNFSFVSERDLTACGTTPATHIRIENPLSEQQAYLRGTLLPGLLKNVRDNLRFAEQVRIFEWGKVFHAHGANAEESQVLALAATGLHAWRELRGTIEEVLTALGAPALHVTQMQERSAAAAARLAAGKVTLGTLVRVAPTTLQAYKIKQPVCVATLRVDELLALAQSRIFAPFSQFPAVKRDLAFWVKEGVEYGKIEAVITAADPLLVRAELFDLHPQGGEVSYAFHLTFQDPTRTLAAEEVERILSALSTTLTQAVGARVRT